MRTTPCWSLGWSSYTSFTVIYTKQKNGFKVIQSSETVYKCRARVFEQRLEYKFGFLTEPKIISRRKNFQENGLRFKAILKGLSLGGISPGEDMKKHAYPFVISRICLPVSQFR